MAEKSSKINSSVVYKNKKRLGSYFDALSVDLKASSRRMQVYGEVLLKKVTELGIYAGESLCTEGGASAFKNALKFYNMGITALKEPFSGPTDLDGLSQDFKQHVPLGVKLFDEMFDFAQMEPKDVAQWQVLRDILQFHHEKWDGTGYPDGAKEQNIPLSARICAVCNQLEYLTATSPERDKMTMEGAADEIARRAGKDFDPFVVEALKACVDNINEILENGTVAKASTGDTAVRAIEQLYRVVYDHDNHAPFGYDTDFRLNDIELGVVPGKTVIPVAEKCSKINDIIKWSVEEACNTILLMKKRNRYTGEFFLFLSVKSLLQANFIENVLRIVTKSGVNPQEICFVISENIMSYNVDTLSKSVFKLHDVGFKLAIGNFGGESVNLSVLQKLDVEYIFLNPEFVTDILVSSRAKQIVETVIDLGNKLSITVIADGVVSKQQAKELYTMGCNYMCGSYFGRYIAVNII